jgi:hypothetical protein
MTIVRAFLLVLPAAAFALCLVAAEVPAHPRSIDTRHAMVAGINAAAVAIWDITNAASGDDGELDPTRMDDEAWARLREHAETLEIWSHQMATADVITAAGPDLVDGQVPEGAASREEIQAMIDRDPAGFRAQSADLAERARLLMQAARDRDPVAAGHRAAEIDAPCQSCHTRYWYKQST